MKCRLCLQEKKIIDSHIIPEYFYIPLYSKEKPKRFYIITNDPDKKKKIEQTGFREKLLCHECDNLLIGKHERYAKDIIHNILSRIKSKLILRLLTLNDIDYKSFKLFQLSILWRVSISSLYEFSKINLSDYENDTLRRMILEQYPGEPKDFGCQLVYPVFKNKIIRRTIKPEIIIPPEDPIIIGNYEAYRMFFNQLHWIFFITDKDSGIYSELFLSKSGTLPVFKIKKFGWHFSFDAQPVTSGKSS